jgi:ATP phosphoribosyltransferase
MLDENLVDLVVCGDDLIDESGIHAEVLMYTGLQPCHIVLVGRKDALSTGSLRVGTQYPNLGARLLREGRFRGWSLRPILGSAEAWIQAGHIDAAIDTWRTGFTADINGLHLLHTYHSTSLVISMRRFTDDQTRASAVRFVKAFSQWLVEPLKPSAGTLL